MKRILLLLPLMLGLPACSNANVLDVTCTVEMTRTRFNEPDDEMTFVEKFVISDKFDLASVISKSFEGEWLPPEASEFMESPHSFVIYYDYEEGSRTVATISTKDPSVVSIRDEGEFGLDYDSFTCKNN